MASPQDPNPLQDETSQTTMESTQPPNPIQDETDLAWQALIPRMNNLIISLRQRSDTGAVTVPEAERQEVITEMTAMMEEIGAEMDRLSSLMEAQMAIMKARMKEKEDMIVLEEGIVGFLLRGGSPPDHEDFGDLEDFEENLEDD